MNSAAYAGMTNNTGKRALVATTSSGVVCAAVLMSVGIVDVESPLHVVNNMHLGDSDSVDSNTTA